MEARRRKFKCWVLDDSVELKTPRGKKKRKRRKKNEDQLEGSIKALDRYKDHVQRIPNVCDSSIVGLGPNAHNEYLRLRLKHTMESLRCMCLDRNAIVEKMPNETRTNAISTRINFGAYKLHSRSNKYR